MEDFDNDGLLDVVTSSMDMCEPMHFFHNNGDGTFTDRAAQAGLADQLGGLNVVAADYNNDGCMDILVLRGGWEFPVRRSLLRNNCDGTFTDVTQARRAGRDGDSDADSGLRRISTMMGTSTCSSVTRMLPASCFATRAMGPSKIFRMRRALTARRTPKGVAATDYDNDGYVDFYVSNVNGANFLYHNNHDRTFTEVGMQAGVQAPWFSFATWFFDYDNDGWPDLFCDQLFQFGGRVDAERARTSA